jgi:hypothetical protein
VTDFYTLLKQSIVAREIRDPARRQSIYAQARSALLRQLSAQQPQLSQADINASVDQFDRAMRQIEEELSAEMGADGDGGAAERGYRRAPQIEREATGWDVRDEAVEDDDPLQDIEPDVPHRRQWREDQAEWAAPVARRGAGVPMVADEADLPPPLPYRDQWNDEEAVYREEAPPAPRRLPPPQRRLGWTLSERDKVRVLVGAIGALALILIGLLIYLFLPGRDAGVTVPINPRGAVSDAATADRIARESLDVKQSFVLFDGRDPTVFQASSDNPVRLDSDAQGAFARVATSTASTGVKVAIGPGLAARLAGQNIRVVVTARSAVERGALNMRFAYQSGVALSHWQTANLASAYGSVGMTWIVPQLRTSTNGFDYLIVEPGIPGDGTAADIKSIRIDLLGSAPAT